MTYGAPVSILDILPTVAAGDGVKIPAIKQLDGVNLLPYLSGKAKGQPHEVLYWNLEKLAPSARASGSILSDRGSDITALFDLSTDPAEKNDLAKARPAIFALNSLYAAWEKTLPPPSWTN